MNNIESKAGREQVKNLRRRVNRQYGLGRMRDEDFVFLKGHLRQIDSRLRDMSHREEVQDAIQ